MSNKPSEAGGSSAMPAAPHRSNKATPQKQVTAKGAELKESKAPDLQDINLDTLNGHQLRALLDQKGISHKDCKNKAELVQRAMYHGVGTA